MRVLRLILSAGVLLVLFACGVSGQDRLSPRWLRHTPESLSPGIRFTAVTVPYINRQGAGNLALGKLSETLENEMTLQKSQTIDDSSLLTRENGSITGSSRTQATSLKITVDGSPITVRCVLADEWWNPKSREYSALYQVAESGNSDFCTTTTTTKYGALPVVLSLVPGAGQFYKGDALKGGLLLGACAAGGAGIILCESQRKAFENQRAQTHDVNLIKQYAAAESNLGIARNVCIGITAALYVYNIIDAAAAPGARRIVIAPDGVRIKF